MKGIEKLTPIRLAEVLTQRGLVPNETITDALYSQDRYGESFSEVLVSSGQINEWDLAKVVVEVFGIPFMMASSYDITKEAQSAIPKELLFRHMVVPLDRLGNVVTVTMPILTPFDVLGKIGRESGCEIYPFVGLIGENRKVLANIYSDYEDWRLEQEKKREELRKSRSNRKERGGDWMSMFDSADEQVRKDRRDP
ncbi:MAG: hypothetical protein AB7I19_04710 [Planctomycetota bacterium]